MMSKTWCQNVKHHTDDAGPYTYPIIRCVDKMCGPPLQACCMSHAQRALVKWRALLKFEVLDVKQDLIQYARELALPYVPLEWQIIDPYRQGILDHLREVV